MSDVCLACFGLVFVSVRSPFPPPCTCLSSGISTPAFHKTVTTSQKATRHQQPIPRWIVVPFMVCWCATLLAVTPLNLPADLDWLFVCLPACLTPVLSCFQDYLSAFAVWQACQPADILWILSSMPPPRIPPPHLCLNTKTTTMSSSTIQSCLFFYLVCRVSAFVRASTLIHDGKSHFPAEIFWKLSHSLKGNSIYFLGLKIENRK